MIESAAVECVRQAVAVICRADVSSLAPQTRPADVKGWDSFGRLQVILEVERATSAELPLEAAFKADSIAALAELLLKAMP